MIGACTVRPRAGERGPGVTATGDWRIGETVPWTSAWTGEGSYALQRSTDFPGLVELVQKEDQGAGAPLFAAMHITRHRRAMVQHLCHVCGRATPPQDRFLFPLESGGMVPMGDGTFRYGGNVPPVHLDCAAKAKARCPHLSHHVGKPVPFPEDEGRMVQRTDILPGFEELVRAMAIPSDVVLSCYRLYDEAFTRLVETLGPATRPT